MGRGLGAQWSRGKKVRAPLGYLWVSLTPPALAAWMVFFHPVAAPALGSLRARPWSRGPLPHGPVSPLPGRPPPDGPLPDKPDMPLHGGPYRPLPNSQYLAFLTSPCQRFHCQASLSTQILTIDRPTGRYAGRQACRQASRRAGTQKGRQTGSQTDSVIQFPC